MIVLFLFGAISQGIENNKVEGEYKSTMYLGDSYVNTYIKLYDDGSMGMNRKSKINGGSEIKQEGSGCWEKLGNNKIYLNTSDSRFGWSADLTLWKVDEQLPMGFLNFLASMD